MLLSFSFKHITFSSLSSHIAFHKVSGLKFFYGTCKNLPSKYIKWDFCFVFGALLFLLLATLILETSGLEIILFLSQNEDSVNTKCKVELREVLQQVVSLHWNKCWFVQKKKKSMPFLDLVSLDFLFHFFAEEMHASWLQQWAQPAVRHYRKAAPMCTPSRCVGLAVTVLRLAWDLCWAQTRGRGMGEWSQMHTDTASGLQLSCVGQLLYFWAFPHLFMQ